MDGAAVSAARPATPSANTVKTGPSGTSRRQPPVRRASTARVLPGVSRHPTCSRRPIVTHAPPVPLPARSPYASGERRSRLVDVAGCDAHFPCARSGREADLPGATGRPIADFPGSRDYCAVREPTTRSDADTHCGITHRDSLRMPSGTTRSAVNYLYNDIGMRWLLASGANRSHSLALMPQTGSRTAGKPSSGSNDVVHQAQIVTTTG